ARRPAGESRQLRDLPTEPGAIAAPELRSGTARPAGAEVRHQRDRSVDRRTNLQRADDPLGFLDVIQRLVALLPGNRDVGLGRDPLALDLFLELADVLFGVRHRDDEVLGVDARAQLVALNLQARPLERLLPLVALAFRLRDH